MCQCTGAKRTQLPAPIPDQSRNIREDSTVYNVQKYDTRSDLLSLPGMGAVIHNPQINDRRVASTLSLSFKVLPFQFSCFHVPSHVSFIKDKCLIRIFPFVIIITLTDISDGFPFVSFLQDM